MWLRESLLQERHCKSYNKYKMPDLALCLMNAACTLYLCSLCDYLNKNMFRYRALDSLMDVVYISCEERTESLYKM